MPVYPGDPPVEITLTSAIGKGDPANVSHLSMGAHTGAHVDSPRHFIDTGRGVDQTPLEILLGPALVVELGRTDSICATDLLPLALESEQRVLFKTSNSVLWHTQEFQKDFVYLRADAADYLVKAGVKLVGVDYLSVEKFGSKENLAHLTLLKAGVIIVEGLNLLDVTPGRYELICLPLKIEGCDGAPCRAVLVET
ncbi:MAG: cyclase family protein [Candidatus Abyssubacteria bacterium]